MRHVLVPRLLPCVLSPRCSNQPVNGVVLIPAIASSQSGREIGVPVRAAGGKFEEIADPTPFASTLVAALRSQKTAAGLKPWLMTINNVNVAQRHQIYCLCMATLEVLAIPESERYSRIDAWCTKAGKLQAEIAALVDDQKTRYVASPNALLGALRKA